MALSPAEIRALISNVPAKDYLGRGRELLDLERILYGPK